MELDDLMCKHSDTYRFHGVKAETLSRLVRQAENGQIVLWGRVEDEDGEASYEQGVGELSTTRWEDVEMSCNEFVDEGGVVLVLEPVVDEPQEEQHPTDRRECLVRAEEWRVIGALRPVLDEDEEIVEFQALSMNDL